MLFQFVKPPSKKRCGIHLVDVSILKLNYQQVYIHCFTFYPATLYPYTTLYLNLRGRWRNVLILINKPWMLHFFFSLKLLIFGRTRAKSAIVVLRPRKSLITLIYVAGPTNLWPLVFPNFPISRWFFRGGPLWPVLNARLNFGPTPPSYTQ